MEPRVRSRAPRSKLIGRCALANGRWWLCPRWSSNPPLPPSLSSGSFKLPPPFSLTPRQRGEDCYRLIPSKASVAQPPPPPPPLQEALRFKRGSWRGHGRNPKVTSVLGYCGSLPRGERGSRSDTEKQDAGMPGCHKAQSSTAKWQKGRIKHPSI